MKVHDIARIPAMQTALISAVAVQMLGRAGRDRWCEFLPISQGPAAETFLAVYPATRFLCLHRRFADVARAAIQANPWGLAGHAYSPFMAAHPGSTISALADYWVTQTSALLAFEKRNPEACLRIPWENLVRSGSQASRDIASFLGISDLGGSTPLAGEQGALTQVPVDQVTPGLLTQVNDLLLQLGYT